MNCKIVRSKVDCMRMNIGDKYISNDKIKLAAYFNL